MNSISSRLKAIAVTALFFALSAFCLLGIVWIGAMVPSPLRGALVDYRPHDTIALFSDLRLPIALTASFLMATAIVVIFSSAYLDRMIAIFADVLLMLMAALVGFVAGYWVLLRLAGYENFLDWSFARIAIVPPLIVFLVSTISPAWARAAFWRRGLTVVLLIVAAPVVLTTLP